MTEKNFKPVKGGWLILACFLVPLFIASNSYAIPFGTTVDNVTITYSTVVNNLTLTGGSATQSYYTDYTFNAPSIVVPLDAFCVENAVINNPSTYEIIALNDPRADNADLLIAAYIADSYWNGLITDKSAAQIAIWNVMFDDDETIDSGIVAYGGGGSFAEDINTILSLYGNTSITEFDTIGLAVSPHDGGYGAGPSQDYLVSVPDASMMFLLGPAMIGMAIFRRKRKS